MNELASSLRGRTVFLLCNVALVVAIGAPVALDTHRRVSAGTAVGAPQSAPELRGACSSPVAQVPPALRLEPGAPFTAGGAQHASEQQSDESCDDCLLEREPSGALARPSPHAAETGLSCEGAGELYAESREREIRANDAVNSAEYARAHAGDNSYVWDREHASLAWLHDHVDERGCWNARTYQTTSRRTNAAWTGNMRDTEMWSELSESGALDSELEVSALSLLTFVGAGYDHKEGDWRHTCRAALIWLRGQLGEDGVFFNARNRREQAIATMALCDAFGLSGDNIIKVLAERALEGLLRQRTTGSGWGLDEFAAPDILTTFYGVMAVKTAKMAGLEIDTTQVYAELAEFIAMLAEPDSPATRYSLHLERIPDAELDGHTRGPIEAAAWVVMMLFMGKADLNDRRITQRAKLLAEPANGPAWEPGRVDYEYWYIGTLALYQVGGGAWKVWQKAIAEVLMNHQRGRHASDVALGRTQKQVLMEHGSWDAIDPWNADGGRIRATALASLTLEVYYRYLRLDDSDDPVRED